MPPTPATRPNGNRQLWLDRLAAAGHDAAALLAESTHVIIAIRGLFANSIGRPGANDINAYDDGIALLTATGDKLPTWNANTDPTRYGWNPGAGKFMARLKPGAWWMHHRRHGASRVGGGYMAFGQCERDVTVERIDSDGNVRQTETGTFDIDLHPGGENTTSSEGCQTVPRPQWKSLYDALPKSAWFRYILIDATTLPENLR